MKIVTPALQASASLQVPSGIVKQKTWKSDTDAYVHAS